MQPTWRNIRYEEIGDGFVSTSSTSTATFCKTLASFGLNRNQTQQLQMSSVANQNSNSSKEQKEELWTRFRFNMTTSSTSSGVSVVSNNNKYYGEKAVVGVEIGTAPTTATGAGTSTPLLHVLLRNDGVFCVKKGQYGTNKSSSNKTDSSSCFGNLAPPSVAVLKKGGSSCGVSVPVASPEFDNNIVNMPNCSPNFNDDIPLLLCRLPPCCVFVPGSTVLVRSHFAFSSCIVIEWLVFCSSSCGFVSTTNNSGSAMSENNNNNSNNVVDSSSSSSSCVLITMSIPIDQSSPMMMQNTCGGAIETIFSVDAVAGQSANITLPVSRPPNFNNRANRHNNESEASSSSMTQAEFVGDYVQAASRDFLLRAPALMLSNPSCDLNSLLLSSSSASSSSSPASCVNSPPLSPSNLHKNSNHNNNNNPTSPLASSVRSLNNITVLGSSSSSTILSASISNTAATATTQPSTASTSNILSEGFTNADVMRLATSSSSVAATTAAAAAIFTNSSSTHPAYIDLRAEKSFKKLEQLVDMF